MINISLHIRKLPPAIGIKASIDSMKEENKSWREQFSQMVTDVSDIKDSVEMARNLINDEKKERQTAMSEMKKLMMDS